MHFFAPLKLLSIFFFHIWCFFLVLGHGGAKSYSATGGAPAPPHRAHNAAKSPAPIERTILQAMHHLFALPKTGDLVRDAAASSCVHHVIGGEMAVRHASSAIGE